jgi:hypothetical protein
MVMTYRFRKTVTDGAPRAGGSRAVLTPEHLSTSFPTILMVEFGGYLPTLPSF